MMLLGDDPVVRFCNLAAQKPFRWGGLDGSVDCLTNLADWVLACRDVDPALPWRGAYDDALGAARIVKASGGMVGLVELAVRDFGIHRTRKPRRGDIAIVPAAGPGARAFDGLAGAVLLEGTAGLLCSDGMIYQRLADFPPVAAWRL